MNFSNWAKFERRSELGNLKSPGIYAIAISDKDIAGTLFEYRREIVYFGMTNSKSGLGGRLDQFNNTLRDRPGHGGAERFRYDHEDGRALARKLYASVCPFNCDVSSIERKHLEAMGDVVRAEYVAFANYAELFGALPKYNDKKNSPKRRRVQPTSS
jgi:hypothetical protein